MPRIWENIELNIEDLNAMVDDNETLNKLGQGISEKIVACTKSLTLIAPGERQPEVLPVLRALLKAIQPAAKLEVLRFKGSELDLQSWAALDNFLNASSRATFRNNIKELAFPRHTTESAMELSAKEPVSSAWSRTIGYQGRIHWKCLSKTKQQSISISLDGVPISAHRPSTGSSSEVVARFVKLMNVPQSVELLEVSPQYTSAFRGLLSVLNLGGTDNLTVVHKLKMTNALLSDDGEGSDFDFIDLSKLDEVQFHNCYDPLTAFGKLIRKREILRLKTFVLVSKKASWYLHNSNHPYNMENLLVSVPSLEVVRLIVASHCILDIRRILSNLGNLQRFTIRIGSQDFVLQWFAIFRTMCPGLKHLGFAYSKVTSVIQKSHVVTLLVDRFRDRAREIVQFQCLESIEVIMPLVNRAVLRYFHLPGSECPLMRAARWMFEILEEEYNKYAGTPIHKVRKIYLELSNPTLGDDDEGRSDWHKGFKKVFDYSQFYQDTSADAKAV
jgi:hypothetical protein